MLNDYNAKYGMTFQLANYAKYKKDVAKRLAHKKPYIKETSILDTIQFCPCFAVSGLARACFCSKPA
jgi:hypothetical protein